MSDYYEMRISDLEEMVKEIRTENAELAQENKILISELEDARRILLKEGLLKWRQKVKE